MIAPRSTKTHSISLKGPVHTALFLYKNGEKDLLSCESVHKNATKTEVFENAIKSGYPQKKNGGFENTFDQCERTKTEVFEIAVISNNELHKIGAM